MVSLAQVTPSDFVADLGSGDGRIAIEFAKAGCRVDGYELDLELVYKSQQDVKANKQDTRITIINADFWTVLLSSYSVVAVYPMPDIMEALENKLLNELAPGARVLTNYYAFPNWEYKTVKDNVYLYVK